MKKLIRIALIFALLPGFQMLAQNQNQDLLKSVDEVLAKVVEIRGLDPITPIQRGIKNRQEIEEYILKRFKEEYPLEDLKIEEQVLKLFKLIPENLNLHDFLIEFYTEQIAGLYDPVLKEFFIADWIPLELQKPVMAHELTHALQDQYFDLERFTSRIPGNDDEMLARAALVEGEALLIMLEYSLSPLGSSVFDIPDIRMMTESQRSLMEAQFPVFASAPEYLKETSLFPYSYGAAFLQFLLKKKEWKELEEVFKLTPVSSEQIMHPEKYRLNPDTPEVIPEVEKLPEELNLNAKPIYSNVLGEFTVYLILKQFLEPDESAQAAAGWDGDRIQLFQSQSQQTIARIETVWDSFQDAAEFKKAYENLLPLKYDGIKRETTINPRQQEVWKNESHTVILEQKTNKVVVIEAEIEQQD